MARPRAETGPPRPAGALALAGWVLFDWAAQPFYTLVLTFLFAPYFATVYIGDPVHGQALWGYLTGAAGVVVALAGPVLGAIADNSGRRKPWVAVFSLGLVVGLCGLWLAEPRALSLQLVVASFLLAAVSAEFATVFTNAMMPALAPPDRLGRLSGIGWAAGYAGGLASLLIAAGLLIVDGETGVTILGLKSALPLDGLSHEGERAIGPFSALWYLVFVLPLFLFTPDAGPARAPSRAPVRDGVRQLRRTLRDVSRYAGIARFLLARMLFVDGLGAIFAFGGIYAAAVFGWDSAALGAFGVILTLAAAAGALVGGPLDDRLGAAAVIRVSLILLMLAALGVVSVDRGHVLFFWSVAPAAAGDGLFASAGERAYMAFAILIGLAAGPLQSASRTYLARRAPPEMMTEFFGLYAFSGKITAFAAPLLVALVTAATGSQRWGIAVVLLFLAGGLALMPGRDGVAGGK